MKSVYVYIYEPDQYARIGLEKTAKTLKADYFPVTIFESASLPAFIASPKSGVRILCTDTLFTAEGREWLTTVIKLNMTYPNIKLLCLCRNRLCELVRQTAILTGCRVQVIPVQSFAKAPTQGGDSSAESGDDLPEGLLTVRERKVLKLLLIGISVENISRIMNISQKTVYSLKLRALKRFGVNDINRLYYLRDAVRVI